MTDRIIGLRLDERLAARLETERKAREMELGRSVPMASFVRRLVLLALDGPPDDRRRAVLDAPLAAPPEAVRRWQDRMGQGEAARRLAAAERQRQLWERFNAVCHQHRVRPPHFVQALAGLDVVITSPVCAAWFFHGHLPEGDAGRDLLDAIVAFVEHLESTPTAER